MLERNMRQILVKEGRKNGVLVWFIETRGTALGMADLLFAGGSRGGVVELKVSKHTGRRIRVNYRPGQRMFLNLHATGNPLTYVLLYYVGVYYLIDGFTGFPEEYEDMSQLMESCIWHGDNINSALFSALITGRINVESKAKIRG